MREINSERGKKIGREGKEGGDVKIEKSRQER